LKRDGGTIARIVAIVADLLAGREHDRHSIARSAGVALAAADRYTRELAKLPGVLVQRRGRMKFLRMKVGVVSAVRGRPPRPPPPMYMSPADRACAQELADRAAGIFPRAKGGD
jgi:hypothetical protein